MISVSVESVTLSERGFPLARQFDDIFVGLALPFEGDEVRVRTQAGREMLYITARTAANRLDDVLGPANWWDKYIPMEKAVVCELTIRLADGTTVTKSDAGAYSDMPDEGDGEKAGFSDAFKRAAAKFGVGRHLYGDGVPEFVRVLLGRQDDPSLMAQPKVGGGHGGRPIGGYNPPPPSRGRDEVNRTFGGNGGAQQGAGRQFEPSKVDEMPRDGKKLWGWCLDRQKEGHENIVREVNTIVEKHFGRKKMTEMSPQQVEAVWADIQNEIDIPF